MKSKYNILGDVHILELPVRPQSPTKNYEDHLQKIEGGYIRYCYYVVQVSGRKNYGRRALLIPENLNAELHLKALEKGLLKPELWVSFAQKVLEYAGVP